MKNLIRLLGIVALAAVIGFAMTACPDGSGGGGGGGSGKPLSGTVSITGTAEVGQELTADISGLAGSGTASYQWNRGNTAVAGAKTAVYTAAAADVGYTVSVTVTRSGFSGSVTSEPTGFVTDPALPTLTGTVGITGTPEVGETLTADISGLDGTGTVHYQWKRAGIVTGTDNVAYKTQDADKGFTITVTVTYTGNSGSKTSAPTAAITNPALPELTGTVSITGTGALGTALTADISALGGSGTISYQWNRDGTAAIPGADKSAYTVTAADVTHAITVTVTREDNNGSKTSAPVTAYDPAAPNLEGTVIIAINGDYAQVENILTATFLPDFGFTPVGTAHYQWKKVNGGSIVNTGEDINTYTIADADIGYAITVAVSYSGNSGAISSRPTAVITKSTLAAFSATVGITGNAYVGETLTASVTAPSGNTGTRVYQWKRAGDEGTVVVATGNNENTYNVTAADISCTLTVTVSYTGNCNWITSEPTAAVIYPPLTGTVTITGTAEVGETLTAVITALNGTGTPSYQWKRGETEIGTAGTYTVQLADVGSTITVTVTRAGYSGSQTGGPTATVPPHLTGTVSISGDAKVGQTLTAVTTALDGEGDITYQWKRGDTVIGTDSNYVIQAEDAGSTITVTVTRSGYTGSKTSQPTATVIILGLTGSVSISGTAELGQTLTAVTTALEGDGTISYQWKRVGTEDSITDIGTDSNTYVVQIDDVGFTITVTVTRAFNSGSKTSDPTAVVTLPALTGSVTITGYAEVGQTLTANISALNGNTTAVYQWKRGESVIVTGSANSTYVVQAADVGSTITVTVTRSLYSGSVTSTPTVNVIPVYNRGDTGPGGGLIFYKKAAHSNGWRYLEAAPARGGNGVSWATVSYQSTLIPGTFGTAIGTGKANTALILATDANAPAAGLCSSYNGGGLSDWYLPSKDELDEIYLSRSVSGITFATNYYYWSSTQASATTAHGLAATGNTDTSQKNSSNRMLAFPIRQF